MVSLRDQGYDDEYLVFVETNFRIDYLIPMIKNEYFSEEVYNSLKMDNNAFILNDENGLLTVANKVDVADDSIGEINLLGIFLSDEFKKISTKCEAGVGVSYFKEPQKRVRATGELLKNRSLLDYVTKDCNTGLYVFNEHWYEKTDNDGITYRNGSKERTLDVSVEHPENIRVLRINKNSIFVKISGKCKWLNSNLDEGKLYSLEMGTLERKNSKNEEYFIQKSSLTALKDAEKQLISHIENMIRES